MKRETARGGGFNALKLTSAALLITGMLGLAACAPQAAPASNASAETADVSQPPASTSVRLNDYDPQAPIVKTLPNGVVVQRTPDVADPAARDDASYVMEMPNYNTYFLQADARGCGACHDDLGATIDNSAYGFHHKLSNELGIEITVQQCMSCHDETRSFSPDQNLGTLIHGLHRESAECMDCHEITNDGQGTQLWDMVKHERLRGITSVAAKDMSQDFSYRTDETVETSALFDVNWKRYAADLDRYYHVQDGDTVDESLYDEWTIYVNGEVDNPTTFTLRELIDNAPSETMLVKNICLANPVGGPLVGQVEVTGIPVEWILEQVGVKDTGHVLRAWTGEVKGSERHLDYVLNHNAMLIYKINGETLTWEDGFPCTLMTGGVASDYNIKSVIGFSVLPEMANEVYAVESDGEVDWAATSGTTEGKTNFSGEHFAKPNVGLFDLYEGQIIKVGEPFTIHGYADGFDERIAAVEISMDMGATWTTFETPQTTSDQWTTWTYTFTPDKETAYCFYVRSVSESGAVTSGGPVQKMVVAKSDVDA